MKKIPVIVAICILWIIIGSIPIFLDAPAPTSFFFSNRPIAEWIGKLFLVAVILTAIAIVWKHDGERVRTKVVRYCGFALLAGLLTNLHYYTVDVACMGWQIDQYDGVLRHSYLPPDQYRFISQGTLWWMVLTNSDFLFSYEAFRFFFTFLLCLSIYRLARCYLSPQNSVLIVFLYGMFYPLSTRYYYGNLLDPMSHLVMLTAFYYCHQKKFWSFFWLFILGVFIKETMLILAPCYYLMNMKDTRLLEKNNWQRILLLGVTGMAVFFLCRRPLGFSFNFQALNRTPGSMLFANLGLARAKVFSTVPIFERYLHPILFLFMWLPLIMWQRQRLPKSLFWTSLYFAAGLFLTNLFFGWNYESRNFVPGLVLLLISTMIILVKWLAEDKAGTSLTTV